MGLTAYVLVYWIFLRPWFQNQTCERAVLPLMALNIFRFTRPGAERDLRSL